MKNKTEKKSNKSSVALYIKYEEGNLDERQNDTVMRQTETAGCL